MLQNFKKIIKEEEREGEEGKREKRGERLKTGRETGMKTEI